MGNIYVMCARFLKFIYFLSNSRTKHWNAHFAKWFKQRKHIFNFLLFSILCKSVGLSSCQTIDTHPILRYKFTGIVFNDWYLYINMSTTQTCCLRDYFCPGSFIKHLKIHVCFYFFSTVNSLELARPPTHCPNITRGIVNFIYIYMY